MEIRLEQQQQQLLKQQKKEQQQQQQLETKSNQKVNFVEPDQISNSSKVSNVSSRSQGSPSVFPEAGLESSGGSGAEQDGNATEKKKSRKDYISMTDEEILKAQLHAKRVGYKVTTV